MFGRLILKLNSFFELDVKKIIKKASYLLGGQAVGNGLSFLVALGAAHFISKETYGTYRKNSKTTWNSCLHAKTAKPRITRSAPRNYRENVAKRVNTC